jgi:poly-beta-1,6-N-acetyl-D-glucosamine synthase
MDASFALALTRPATTTHAGPSADPPSPRTTRGVALLPAHGEASTIRDAIHVIEQQVDEVIVVADDCTDRTAILAEQLPVLPTTDLSLVQDADSALDEASAARLAKRIPAGGANTTTTLALVPAHNEEAGIAATINALGLQTHAPDRVIVIADNCTDRTVEIARAHGVEVIETVSNVHKKAGALNQGLSYLLETSDQLDDDFCVLAMDADSQLDPDFIENGLQLLATFPDIGGLSGAIHPRTPQNFIERAQAIEFAKGTRLMSRRQGKVHVLSGAASIFPFRVLREVAEARGSRLPGVQGTYFMEDSLTEDYELTLAVRSLGYRCSSTKRCRVVTDLMPTLHDLSLQRIRWQRGAIESLQLYGWSKLTRKTWLGVGFTYVQSLILPLIVTLLVVGFVLWGAQPDLRWLALMPLFLVEHVINARRVGGRTRFLPFYFFPLWFYENLMFVFAWRALFQLQRGTSRTWVT